MPHIVNELMIGEIYIYVPMTRPALKNEHL